MLTMALLTFLHCGATSHCTAFVDKHFDYFTLQLMTRGHLEVFYDDEEYSLRGGWLWPAMPGPHIRFHRASGCKSWEHRYVAFRGAPVNEWKAAGLWLQAPQRLPHPNVVRLFDELISQVRKSDGWSVRRATNLLECILLELAEARMQAPSSEAWLEQALQKLHECGDFAPDYAKLARDCGLGLSTLRRHFKAATGTSLHNYVMQLRIARAKELLGETDRPLKTIATELGFRDVYFFSSQFRKLADVSPSVYRKSRQL